MFSYKNETGIYEISKKTKKYFSEIIISTNYLFDKKKKLYFFLKDANIICDLAKKIRKI